MMQNDIIDIFIKEKKDQCERLIGFGIWKGIDSNNLRAWLKNFSSIEEKYFAVCVLDWLVYRNDDHVVSMLYDLLTKHLHNQWRLDKNPLYKENCNPLDLLRKKWKSEDIGFRYVTAVKSSDKATKSGYHMISVMNHSLDISSNWNIKPSEIRSSYDAGIRTFIFVDDITGTGDQMCEVINESQITTLNNTLVYVLICAAHENAINKIHGNYPEVKILYAEYIPINANLFKNLPLDQFTMDSPDLIHEWYVTFMENKGINPKNSVGRGDLGLVYAFQNNVPNNSLPLLFLENRDLNKLIKKRA